MIKRIGKIKLILLSILFVITFFVFVGYKNYSNYMEKLSPLKNVKIGVSEEIKLDLFFDSYIADVSFVTDVDKIDTSKLGEHEIEIKVENKVFFSDLFIVDENKPVVEVKDLKLSFYEEITPEMFIVSVYDETSYLVRFKNDFVKKSGEQVLIIEVIDEANNITEKEVNLNLVKVKDEVEFEAGSKFSLESVLYGADRILDKRVIKSFDTKKIGKQELVIEIDGEEHSVLVNVVDNQKPIVKTKSVTIWWDEKVSSVDKFIKSVSDATKVRKEYVNSIDYSKIGKQVVKIKVVDEGGNETLVDTTLTIKKDTSPPVFKNLNTITLIRGNKVDYRKNVKVYDNHDSKVNYTVDSSGVDLNKVGTYYVKYSAVDISGNVVEKKRKIVINGNLNDIKDNLRPIVNSITSSGNTESQNALAIRNWVANNIGYAANGYRNIVESAWDGLVNKKGDCYSHYAIAKVMLDLAGIKNMEVHLISKNHYWNLVYVDGKWRHLDATPGARVTELLTDKEFDENVSSAWDHSKYPDAI